MGGVWGVVVVAVGLIAIGMLLVSYYGRRFVTEFAIARFRIVDGTDHVGPVLEGGWTTISVLAILALSYLVFPTQADALFTDQLTAPPAAVVAVVVAVVVALHLFVWAIDEAGRLLAGEPAALARVPADAAARIGRIDVPPTRRAMRVNAVPYFPYAVVTVLFVVALLWLIGAGLSADASAARVAADAVDAGPAAAALDPAHLAQSQLEAYYTLFRSYQDAALELAVDLTAVMAILAAAAFWLLGTPYLSILAQNVLTVVRTAATVVILVVLPALIVVTFVDVTTVSKQVSAEVASVIESAHDADLAVDTITTLHEIEDRIMSSTEVETFWTRLATSSGGVLLILLALLSMWQERNRGWSFLRGLLPFGHGAGESTATEVARTVVGPGLGDAASPGNGSP